jgi:hypothetical protein
MRDDQRATKGDMMTEDPVQDALDRSPWCLLVPIGDPDDPDIIGPFVSYEEAEIWSRIYAGACIRKMASPELEVLLRRECEEIEASRKPRN